MGIPGGISRLLIEEAKARPFSGTVLQLGRSTVYFSEAELRGWAESQSLRLNQTEPATLSHDPRLAAQGCLSDQSLFSSLGFDQVESCDISEWEGADHILDLNQPLPKELEGQFDVVFETGTILQIFDLPQVLENLHRLLRVGGRVIHCGDAANNHVDLGFYMLSPTFFADFYSANGYRIESQYLCEYRSFWHRGRLHTRNWKIYDYHPGALDGLSFGRYGGHQALSFVVATKTESSTGDIVPQLGQYRNAWREFGQGDVAAAGARAPDDSPTLTTQAGMAARVEEFLERTPGLSATTLFLKARMETIRRRLLPRPMPPLRFRF